MQAITLSEKLAALEFGEKVILINALRKALDRCKEEHQRHQENFPGSTDQYWLEHGRDIYRLYRKLDGFEVHPEFETSADVLAPAS